MARRAANLVFVTLLLSGVFTSGCRTEPVEATAPRAVTEELQRMPAIDLTDIAGRQWNASNFSGKTVLVEFWATWCVPCREIAPELHAFYRRHRASTTLLSISLDESVEVVKAHVQSHPFPNPVMCGGVAASKPWGITQLPALVLVRDGRVISKWQGKDAVRDALKRLDRELR